MTLFDLPVDGAVYERSARLSTLGTYRYSLTRRWGEGPALRWVMLNPSTADADVDDPTIRRVIRFSRDAGYLAAVVANLYALRATDPAELDRHPDPVGPDNEATLAELVPHGWPIVAAWGAHARRRVVAAALAGPLAGAELLCLGTTKNGHPRHPLYVRADQPLVPYVVGER